MKAALNLVERQSVSSETGISEFDKFQNLNDEFDKVCFEALDMELGWLRSKDTGNIPIADEMRKQLDDIVNRMTSITDEMEKLYAHDAQRAAIVADVVTSMRKRTKVQNDFTSGTIKALAAYKTAKAATAQK